MSELVCIAEATPNSDVTAFESEAFTAWRGAKLTPREREVLSILSRGLYYREIGESLGISPNTVRAHLHSTYKKLRVKSRAHAVIKMNEIQRRHAPQIIQA